MMEILFVFDWLSWKKIIKWYIKFKLFILITRYLQLQINSYRLLFGQANLVKSFDNTDIKGEITSSTPEINPFKNKETAFKYLITQAISTGVFLFGVSYMYGITGSLNLSEIYFSLYNAQFSPK